MKRYIIYSLVILMTLLTFGTACSKFEDMNKNPYVLYYAPSESFVHPIMFKTQSNNMTVFRNLTARLMQYCVATGASVSSRVVDLYSIPETTTDDNWAALYLQWGNAMQMHQMAIEEDDQAMQAVALILKSFLITQITDTYGDVPFKDAGKLVLSNGNGVYTTSYDTQKDIYRAVICMLEDANEMLGATDKIKFSAVCDKVYNGEFDMWRRFGNSLYARVLMRVAMKVLEEDEGVLELDDKWEAVSITQKLSELYNSYKNGSGDYPQMRSKEDSPMVPFSEFNEIEHTPFYTTTSGTWNTLVVTDVLVARMLNTVETVDSDGMTYHKYVSSSGSGRVNDPRYDCWWRKTTGMPVHLYHDARVRFLNCKDHKSSLGNSTVGRMTRGTEPSAIWGKTYNLKNGDYYPLMQHSELAFIYAEAGARGWIGSLSGFSGYMSLLKQGITESILEWNPYVTAEDPIVVDYVNYCVNGALYSGQTFNSDNALEAILTQKWIAQFFIGIESWCDYRRTGYPLLRTDGPAAANDRILPTRMRYPADELYRNPQAYPEALDRWLGGTDNIQSDVWWADTQESYQTRLKGRQ